MAIIEFPIVYVPDPLKGRPLFNSQIFVGIADLDPEVPANQKQLNVIQEDGTIVPVTQPFIVGSGGVPIYNGSAVRLDTDGDYSIKILDKLGVQTYYIENNSSKESSLNPDTLGIAIADKTLDNGDVLHVKERTSGNGGGAIWDVVLTSTVTPNTFNIVISTGDALLSLVLRTNKLKLNTLQWGVLESNTATQNSAVVQACIDFGFSLYSETQFSHGGVWVHTPAGIYDFEGVIDKQGVNRSGDGRVNTVWQLVGDNKVGMQNASATTQVSADQLSFGQFKGFSVIPKNPTVELPVNQLIWDITGYSRWKTEDMFIGWCGGCNGVRMTGATLAGSGGPANWYNNFYDVFVERPSSWPAGGVGWELGDEAANKEQITTWGIFGGRTSGDGTGINIKSCNSVNFYNHVIEGTDVVLGSPAGARKAIGVNFYPAYFEGSNTMTIHPNAEGTGLFGEFITGYTVVDNGLRTTRIAGDGTKMAAGFAGTQGWAVEADDSSQRAPVIRDLAGTSSLALEDSTGNLVTMTNGTQTGSATRSFEVTDKDSLNLIRCGVSSSMLAGAEILINNDTALGYFISFGSPEGVKTAKAGSLCINLNGGASTTLYVKESGAGNTGWIAK